MFSIDYDRIPAPTPPTAVGQAVRPNLRKVMLDSNDRAIVAFPYDVAVVEAVKALPEWRTFDGPNRRWLVALTPRNGRGLRAIVREYEFELGPGVREVLDRLDVEGAREQERIESAIAASEAAAADFDVPGLGGVLRPFQRAGVKYLVEMRRTFCADEMGLGKTVQALAALQYLEAFPAAVVCPASLKRNWAREATKWLPGRRVVILNGGRVTASGSPVLFGDDRPADVFVLSYEAMRKWGEELRSRGLRAVVADEAHYVKTHSAKRTKNLKALVTHTDGSKIENVFLLTGTPVLNRPLELVAQLDVIDRLGEFGGYRRFVRRYCEAYETQWGQNASGASHLEELNQKMRATCYIRRTKAQVLKELPPKQRAVVPMEIANRAEYDRAEEDLIAYLMEIDWEKASAAQRAEHLVRIEVLKQLAAKGMMEGVFEWIEDFLATGEKLVLFGWHKNVVEQIAQRFGVPAFHGDTSQQDRDAQVQAFQNDPGRRLMVMNMQSGGVGLTLTAASNVAFVELGWNPATHDQAEDRTHRIGQEADSVNAWYLMAQNTIMDMIWGIIDAKRVVVTAVTDGGPMGAGSILSDLVDAMKAKGEARGMRPREAERAS